MTATAAVRVYASEATIRRRVFGRFALGPGDVDRLAHEIATLRVASYEGRLQQFARSARVSGEVQLADPAVLRRIARESRDVAMGMISTHNDELRAWLASQPRGQSQRDLGAAARTYMQRRTAVHSREAAYNEGMTGRNQAAVDVLRMNEARVRVRAEPRTAGEKLCQEIVSHGWYELGDAPTLPQHPHCKHSWAHSSQFAAVAKSRPRLWLGDWINMRSKGNRENDATDD